MSVYKRGKRWWFRFQLRGVRYARPVPEATTKKQAMAAEAQFKADLLSGRYGLLNQPKRDITFAQYAQQYLKWSKQHKRSYDSDEWRMRVLVDYFGDKRPADISPMDIEWYKVERRKGLTKRGTQRSPASVNRELRLLSHVLTHALRDNLIREHPMKGGKVRMLREDNKVERILTDEEEQRLLDACRGSREHLRPIIITALYTGMRCGEILNLKWSDVDFDRNMIHIRQTKSGKSRTIPLPTTVRAEIEKLKPLAPESEYVFTNPHTGRPFKDIKQGFRKACQGAGITGLRFHDLRHTFATRLARETRNLVDVAHILGHSTIVTTMRYAHASPDRVAEAMDRLSQPPAEIIPLSAKARRGQR